MWKPRTQGLTPLTARPEKRLNIILRSARRLNFAWYAFSFYPGQNDPRRFDLGNVQLNCGLFLPKPVYSPKCRAASRRYHASSRISKMAADSSEEDQENWVFYRDREEWRDVVPVEQDDGPFPVVAIAYTEKCMSVNNLLSARQTHLSNTSMGKPHDHIDMIDYVA